jgi:uncharacterized protein (TIRG00374 family)
VFHALEPAALVAALGEANLLYVLPALGVYFAGLWIRSVRWQLILRPALRGSRGSGGGGRWGEPPADAEPLAPGPADAGADAPRPAVPSVGRLFHVLVVGLTINNLLPARLGELARAYLLWRGERIEAGTTIGTIVLERVLDGLALCTLAGIAALVVPFPPELERAAWAAAGAFLLATCGLVAFMVWPAPFLGIARRVFRLLPPRFAHLGERLVLTFVDGLVVLRRAHTLAAVLALSLLAWLAEATMYFAIMLGFPFPARPAAALLGTAAGNIGTMIPSSPGYVGTFDLPLQIVLTEVFGVPLAAATSYTLVLHAALVIPVILLGLFFLFQDWRGGGHATSGLLRALHGVSTRPASAQPAAAGRRAAGDD